MYQNYQLGIDSNHPNNYIDKIEEISGKDFIYINLFINFLEENSNLTYGN